MVKMYAELDQNKLVVCESYGYNAPDIRIKSLMITNCMRIATDIAGFSATLSDEYRRAIGKKKEELIKEQNHMLIYGSKEHNIPGLLKRGVPLDKAKKLADDIVAFAKYSFNKAHAACYAVITMQTGWLKAHYPIEYMNYLISSYIGKDDEKIVKYIAESRRMGIQILQPDINRSDFEFSIEENSIRYGLGAIKGLSKTAVLIIKDRGKNGEYKSLEDFLSRFDRKSVNKKALDSLILSGTFDELEGTTDRIAILEKAYQLRGETFSKESINEFINKMGNDFVNIGSAKQLYSKVFQDTFINEMQRLQIEQALLGTYISGHPLSGKAEPIDWTSIYEGYVFDVTGIIMDIRKTMTRKKEEMAFVKLETLEGERDIVVFPEAYRNNVNKLDVGGIRIFTVQCKMRIDSPGEYSYITKNIKYYRGESNNAQ